MRGVESSTPPPFAMSIRARHSIIVAALLIAAGTGPQSAAAAERRSTLDDQQSVAVTIYNDELALIKDVRKVVLDAGVGRLALRDVSARMRPETAALRNVLRPGAFDLLEQNFDFDLLTPAKLLEKYVGQTVRIVHPRTGVETVESAQVLAAPQGVGPQSSRPRSAPDVRRHARRRAEDRRPHRDRRSGPDRLRRRAGDASRPADPRRRAEQPASRERRPWSSRI